MGRTHWMKSKPRPASSTTDGRRWDGSHTTSTTCHSFTTNVDRGHLQAAKTANSFSSTFKHDLDIAAIRTIVASNCHNPLSTSG